MRKAKYAILTAVLIACATSTSFAGEDKAIKQNREERTRIQANTFVYNSRTKEATASGSVVITTPDGVTIKTDEAVLSETRPTNKANQVAFNYSILQTVKDSEVFLYILSALKKGNSESVEKFLEYQLDEIVYGLSLKNGQLNKYQQTMAQKALHKIKQYRLKYPRSFKDKSDPALVSQFLGEEDPNIPVESDKILKTIRIEK